MFQSKLFCYFMCNLLCSSSRRYVVHKVQELCSHSPGNVMKIEHLHLIAVPFGSNHIYFHYCFNIMFISSSIKMEIHHLHTVY